MMSVNCQQQILLVPVFMSQHEFIIHINIVNNCSCFHVIALHMLFLKDIFLFCAFVIMPSGCYTYITFKQYFRLNVLNI